MYKKNKDLPYEQQAKLLIHHYDQLVDRRSLDSARRRIKELLNQSIVPKGTGPIESREITIKEYGEFDLSRLDVSQLREQFGKAECKNLEIDDLQGFIEQKLNAKLSQNSERKSFAEAFQEIINRYNAGSIETEQAFDELMKLFSRMSEEQRRASQEGLSEQELEIFDILRKEKLSKEDERKVKHAAQDLLAKLKEHEAELCTVDRYKESTKKQTFYFFVRDTLNETLPESYDRAVFSQKYEALCSQFVCKAVANNGMLFTS